MIKHFSRPAPQRNSKASQGERVALSMITRLRRRPVPFQQRTSFALLKDQSPAACSVNQMVLGWNDGDDDAAQRGFALWLLTLSCNVAPGVTVPEQHSCIRRGGTGWPHNAFAPFSPSSPGANVLNCSELSSIQVILSYRVLNFYFLNVIKWLRPLIYLL